MNAADKEQVKQIARQDRRRRDGILDAWKDVLSTPQGRRLFATILDQLQPRMNLWNRDAACLAFNVARHDVALWIREQIDAAAAPASLPGPINPAASPASAPAARNCT